MTNLNEAATVGAPTGSGRPASVLGLDGKTYPALRLHGDDRAAVIGHAHYLLHAERLSVRQIRARLAEELDVHRSVGWLHNALTAWRCDHCPSVHVHQNGAPEHPAVTR